MRKKNLRCRHIHSASTDLPQVFHIAVAAALASRLDGSERRHYAGSSMFQSVRARFLARLLRLASAFLIWVFALAAPLRYASDVILYRLFMLDGTTAVSYGEFARIAGTVVFSMPLSGL